MLALTWNMFAIYLGRRLLSALKNDDEHVKVNSSLPSDEVSCIVLYCIVLA